MRFRGITLEILEDSKGKFRGITRKFIGKECEVLRDSRKNSRRMVRSSGGLARKYDNKVYTVDMGLGELLTYVLRLDT